MKDLEIWLSFWRKMCFGLREARRRQNIRFEKNWHRLAFKTENPLIFLVRNLRSYSQNGLKRTGHVSRVASSCERVAKELWNSLCEFQRKLKIASSFSWVGSYSRLTLENASEGVFQQKQIWLFGKILNIKMLHKNTFKNI